MPITHFFAEGIGPFKSVHLDFSAPGPHILAGENGAGKSTLLKAIAWSLARDYDGFSAEEFFHLLEGHSHSRALLIHDVPGRGQFATATTRDDQSNLDELSRQGILSWSSNCIESVGLPLANFKLADYRRETVAMLMTSPATYYTSLRAYLGKVFPHPIIVAAYSASRVLSYIEHPRGTNDGHTDSRFAFDETIDNEGVQRWLIDLYSKRAIANQRKQSSSHYTARFDALERCLRYICGSDVSIVIDIEPRLEPRFQMGARKLNFSQLPDGVRATLGWIADFMRRVEALQEDGNQILLFDEVESFLHPLWQRRVLPAAQGALPNTQFIVTSHSPFVISSHRDAVIHVLRVGKDGYAYAEPPVKAPIGQSITATLKGIFDVDSRFDVQTEDELKEWNDLAKQRSAEKLSAKEEARFKELTKTLGERSEELKSIVNPGPKLSDTAIDILTKPANSRRRRLATR